MAADSDCLHQAALSHHPNGSSSQNGPVVPYLTAVMKALANGSLYRGNSTAVATPCVERVRDGADKTACLPRDLGCAPP